MVRLVLPRPMLKRVYFELLHALGHEAVDLRAQGVL